MIDGVRVILPAGSQLTDDQIQASIDAATCAYERSGCSLSASCAANVIKYLFAHFAAVTENTLSVSSQTDPCCGGQVTYGFKFGEGIMGTPFGQIANTLSGGCLSQIDKPDVFLFAI
jgi:hypothetical protein